MGKFYTILYESFLITLKWVLIYACLFAMKYVNLIHQYTEGQKLLEIKQQILSSKFRPYRTKNVMEPELMI